MSLSAPGRFRLVVIGGSAGSTIGLPLILAGLPHDLRLPVVVVRHIAPESTWEFFMRRTDADCALTIIEPDDKEPIFGGHVYMAPPNYHLLIERDYTFSLSVDEKVRYSRPSIDVLFETAADAYGESVIGVIMTGANDDGAAGLKKIKERGGYAIVQDPKTAQVDIMPKAAIAACDVDRILPLERIAEALLELERL
ncbi:MAG: chemotaxis protein CheB [Desulfobulbaceae bacterium]|nr:chemotaxis protein CheB [Desulfobulbaceae bacterium]MCK5545521.1 chemotaxis protein CheB [Desulfobulbaceae bacterium]